MKWVRLYEPSLIPPEYVERVKGRSYSVQDFFEFQDANRDNPCNLLFAYISDNNEFNGYLWAQINALDSTIFVNTLSVAKELWGDGHMIDEAVIFLRKVQDKTEAQRVFWCTTNMRYYLKKGFKTSRIWLMEYNPKDEAKNGTE